MIGKSKLIATHGSGFQPSNLFRAHDLGRCPDEYTHFSSAKGAAIQQPSPTGLGHLKPRDGGLKVRDSLKSMENPRSIRESRTFSPHSSGTYYPALRTISANLFSWPLLARQGLKDISRWCKPPENIPEMYLPRQGQWIHHSQMPSTHLSLHYHLVFSTKDRVGTISPAWRPRLHAFLW